MNKLTAFAKRYINSARSDFNTIGVAVCRPMSHRAAVTLTVFTCLTAVFMCFDIVFAASTPLFSTLESAITNLYNDANSLVETVAMFALVISIIGVFIASMFGAKATAVMTSALKMVIFFFIFWQLIPVVLSTIKNLFGTGGGGGGTP